jgi:hypothetical protein
MADAVTIEPAVTAAAATNAITIFRNMTCPPFGARSAGSPPRLRSWYDIGLPMTCRRE